MANLTLTLPPTDDLEDLLRQIRAPVLPVDPPPLNRRLTTPALRQGQLRQLFAAIAAPVPAPDDPTPNRRLMIDVPEEGWELEDLWLEIISLPHRPRRKVRLKLPYLEYLWEMEVYYELIISPEDPRPEREVRLEINLPPSGELGMLLTEVLRPVPPVRDGQRQRCLEVNVPRDSDLRELLAAIQRGRKPATEADRRLRVRVPADHDLMVLYRQILPVPVEHKPREVWLPPGTPTEPMSEEAVLNAAKYCSIPTRRERAWVSKREQKFRFNRVRPVTADNWADNWPTRKQRERRREAQFPSMVIAGWHVEKREQPVLVAKDGQPVYPYESRRVPAKEKTLSAPYLEVMTWPEVVESAKAQGENPVHQFRAQTQWEHDRIRPGERPRRERRAEHVERCLGFEVTGCCRKPHWLSRAEHTARMGSELGRLLVAEVPNELAWGNPDLQAKYFVPGWARERQDRKRKKRKPKTN